MNHSILIVEDDPNKRRTISLHVRESLPGALLDESGAYQSGLKMALSNEYDLIILDMTMPNYEGLTTAEGGRQRPFAGRDILRELRRNRIATKVVVVTQFESFGQGRRIKDRNELTMELTEHFSGIYVGMIYYSASQNEWKEALARVLREVNHG